MTTIRRGEDPALLSRSRSLLHLPPSLPHLLLHPTHPLHLLHQEHLLLRLENYQTLTAMMTGLKTASNLSLTREEMINQRTIEKIADILDHPVSEAEVLPVEAEHLTLPVHELHHLRHHHLAHQHHPGMRGRGAGARVLMNLRRDTPVPSARGRVWGGWELTLCGLQWSRFLISQEWRRLMTSTGSSVWW